MNLSRLVWPLLLVFWLLRPEPLAAQAPPPFIFPKQYSADMVIATKDGIAVTSKFATDSGKIRAEMEMRGMTVVSIVRPDLQKVYRLMVDRKLVMEMPYDPEQFKKVPLTAGTDEKFAVIGPDTVDGVPCTKYQTTSAEGKVAFLWVDVAKQVPVKMAAEDGSYSVQWKNYKAGPQDAALFEPPADYQKMGIPTMPSGMPGAGAPPVPPAPPVMPPTPPSAPGQ